MIEEWYLQPDILDTNEETKFNDFLKQIKEEQKNKDMSLSEEDFNYKTPGKMLQTLHNLKRSRDIFNWKYYWRLWKESLKHARGCRGCW